MVQLVDHGEEAARVDVLGLAGVEDVLFVVAQGVAEHELDLEHRDVRRIRNRTLHLDLEGLPDVDHRGQAQAAQLQRRRQRDFKPRAVQGRVKGLRFHGGGLLLAPAGGGASRMHATPRPPRGRARKAAPT